MARDKRLLVEDIDNGKKHRVSMKEIKVYYEDGIVLVEKAMKSIQGTMETIKFKAKIVSA